MLRKVICVVAFLGLFTAVSLTSNTAQARRVRRTVWYQPQPVMVVHQPVMVAQPMVVHRPVVVAPRRVYRPVWVW